MSTWTWNPKHVLREVKAFATNSGVVRVETDLSEGYLKALGNKSGPHSLACELVGTKLAEWLGLRVLQYGLIEITAAFQPELGSGVLAEVGPAFITRAEEGHVWSGITRDLSFVDNPNDVALFVVFDTWTRNCDRYQPREHEKPRQNLGNVFLSHEGAQPGRFILKPIDHGCCFTCDRELSPRNLTPQFDNQIYGLFPGFRPFARRETALAALDRLESITRPEIEEIIDCVPSQWDVCAATRSIWCDWIYTRARQVRRIIEKELNPVDLVDGVTEQEEQP